uniref:Uncharacterized protein n=1 Tax=Onchocerca volvulus TaxID=6282 RepID=A0A8R1XWQ8_ONCVO
MDAATISTTIISTVIYSQHFMAHLVLNSYCKEKRVQKITGITRQLLIFTAEHQNIMIVDFINFQKKLGNNNKTNSVTIKFTLFTQINFQDCLRKKCLNLLRKINPIDKMQSNSISCETYRLHKIKILRKKLSIAYSVIDSIIIHVNELAEPFIPRQKWMDVFNRTQCHNRQELHRLDQHCLKSRKKSLQSGLYSNSDGLRCREKEIYMKTAITPICFKAILV